MTHKPGFSFWARMRSFRHAFRGLKFILQAEHNAWIHLAAAGIVCVMSWFLRISGIDWCLLIIAITGVWVTESLNTSIEQLTDLISPEYHPLAGKVKDIAAAAVLIAATGAVLVGAIVLVPAVLKSLSDL